MTVASYAYRPSTEVELVESTARFATIRDVEKGDEWRIRWRNLTYNGLQLRLKGVK